MKYYTIYYETTGEISRLISCATSQIQIQLQQNENYIESYSDDTINYVDINVDIPIILTKQNNTSNISKNDVYADGVDKIVLSATPIGSVVYLGDVTSTSDGTDIDLIFDIPGTYDLKVELFPYLDFEATINAT